MDPQQILRILQIHPMFFAMDDAMKRLYYFVYRGSLTRQFGADGVIRRVWDPKIRQGAAA